ncbi:hypothetical protein PCE1_001623 [Barthelona sp. PCE]
MIRFFVLVNKQGQTRLAKHYIQMPTAQRSALEADIVRLCLSRKSGACNFIDYDDFRVVYRRYASLYFIIGCSKDENEMSLYELIHFTVESFDQYFKRVRELDIMFNIDSAYFLLGEIISNGKIMNTNQSSVIELVNRVVALNQKQ